jgi:hypothetical protein
MDTGLFLRLPVAFLPGLEFIPELDGGFRFAFHWDRFQDDSQGVDRSFADAPWVLELDARLELAFCPGKSFGVACLEPFSLRAGIESPLADPAIMYDRWRWWIGLNVELFKGLAPLR